MRDMEVPHDKINVNGGAIAMGHPLGATGSMILGTVLDELERRDLNTGLITLCVANGLGTAAIIERVYIGRASWRERVCQHVSISAVAVLSKNNTLFEYHPISHTNIYNHPAHLSFK